MKVRPDTKTGSVIVVLTAKEAGTLVEKLFGAAIQSGGAVEDGERQEPTEEHVEEREP